MLLMGCSNGSGTANAIGPDEFAKKIKEDKEAVVVDVRTPQEYQAGHIKGARLIDFYAGDFRSNIKGLDKSKHYYLYCRSGNRSGQTLRMMKDLGFKNVSHLDGGINTWKGKTVSGR